nr:BrnT family toxin [uncultured Rhodopila sp.]
MFEWDDGKNARNVAKHGISFALAKRIFEGPVLTAVDDRADYGELREVSIGMVDGAAVLTVVHTDRQGTVRIISARAASRSERRRYEEALRQADDRTRDRGDT